MTMISLPKMLKNTLPTLVLLGMSAVGAWGADRAAACATETPQFNGLLHGLAWLWGGIALGFAVCAISVRRQARGRVGLLPALYALLVVVCLFSIFIVVHIECTAQTAWLGLIWGGGGLVALGLLLPHLRTRLALMAFSLLLTLLLVEGGYRLYLRLFPIDTSWPLLMDDRIGWRHIPNYERIWSGHDPACVSFHTQMKFNSAGFYDAERSLTKPENTLRIAVIGDSFVEAAQVPFEKRATQVLQARLDREAALTKDGQPLRFEVLNFGISNFSVGQFALTYFAYANQYDPDFVFVLISEVQLLRELPTSGYPIGFGPRSALYLRPTFRLAENGELELITPSPAEQAIYESLLRARMDENGQIKPSYAYSPLPYPTYQSLLENPYAWLLAQSYFGRFLRYRLDAIWSDFQSAYFPPTMSVSPPLSYYDYARAVYSPYPSDTELYALHLAILDKLAERVKADGAELVIVNAAESPLREVLAYFAQDNHVGNIDLTSALREGDMTFLCDAHWNERGNAAAADAIYDWLRRRFDEPYRLWGSDRMAVFEQPDHTWQVYRLENGAGLYVAGFVPPQDALSLTAADGWRVEATPHGRSYRLRLVDPSGIGVDEALVSSGLWR